MATRPTTIDAYIAALPDVQQGIAKSMRQIIKNVIPDAVETVKYNMPSFQLGGVSIIYFAVWKKHLSLYPVYRGTAAFEAEVSPYRSKKDTVQFALDCALPEDLIALIVRSQADKAEDRGQSP